jgi:hypothetical protein
MPVWDWSGITVGNENRAMWDWSGITIGHDDAAVRDRRGFGIPVGNEHRSRHDMVTS